MKNWTTLRDLRQQCLKIWDKGTIIKFLLEDGNLYADDLFANRGAVKIAIKGPRSTDFKNDFPKSIDFTDKWSAQREVKIQFTQITTRLMGTQTIPHSAVFDSVYDFVGFIGKKREYDSIKSSLTEISAPVLEYIKKKPQSYLKYQECFHKIDIIAGYLRNHPKPRIYLRQMALPSIDTKFIENHKGIIGDVLDMLLPADSIDRKENCSSGFARRYGFLDKPLRVRFRILDKNIRIPNINQECPDITLDEKSFATLSLECTNVIVCENEISFLSLPNLRSSIAVFGSGYGFSAFRSARWLQTKNMYYWGDLDTHGFAILREFRMAMSPCQVKSVLMNYETLNKYKALCVEEPKPLNNLLDNLTEEESLAYRALLDCKFSGTQGLKHLRLEQELIPWQEVKDVFFNLAAQ
ncbi:MAG TPA: hypothetical protein DCR21_06195 [Succinivibrionaceae bacterium]|nr:hypothetical protein [Succinivibrionaceae bacterium]